MANLRASEGKLHWGELAKEVVQKVEVGQVFKIATKKSEGSALKGKVGDVLVAKKAMTLDAEDTVRIFTLSKVCSTTNVTKSWSKSKQDVTTQCDEVKAYVEGEYAEGTGNIEGFWNNGSKVQQVVMSKFQPIVSWENDEPQTVKPVTGSLHFFLTRGTEETGITLEYMPLIIDSLTTDKPLEGVQSFNFAYTIDGKQRPTLIENVGALVIAGE